MQNEGQNGILDSVVFLLGAGEDGERRVDRQLEFLDFEGVGAERLKVLGMVRVFRKLGDGVVDEN